MGTPRWSSRDLNGKRLERDLRDAAEVIRESDCPMALMPRLMSDLAKIANTTTDADTQRKLRRLLGEA